MKRSQASSALPARRGPSQGSSGAVSALLIGYQPLASSHGIGRMRVPGLLSMTEQSGDAIPSYDTGREVHPLRSRKDPATMNGMLRAFSGIVTGPWPATVALFVVIGCSEHRPTAP